MNAYPTNDNACVQAGGVVKAKSQRKKHSGNSAEAQRARLLDHLKTCRTITTIEARRDLDILAPAPRIFELRKAGHEIDTVWISATTDAGVIHRVGMYILVGGAA